MLGHLCIMRRSHNVQRWEHNQKWLPHPCLLGAQKRAEMLRHICIMRGPTTPSAGNKIRIGYLIPTSSGAQKWAQMLHLGGPQCQERGTKLELLFGPSLLGAQKRAEMLGYLCIMRGSQNVQHGEQNRKLVAHTYLLGGPKEGRNATSPLHSPGSPKPRAGNKIRSGYLTPTFSGAQKRAEMLHHPCILGVPQHQARGTKSEMATSALPSRGPK